MIAVHENTTVATASAYSSNLEQQQYLPYGSKRGGDALTTTEHGFIGQTEDDTVDLIYLNNRHYDPTTGVFVSVDPLVTITGEPYVYGSANPVTISDPTGLCGCENFEDLSGYAQPYSEASDQNNVTKYWAAGHDQNGDPTGWWSRPRLIGVPAGPRIENVDYRGQIGPAGNAYDAAGAAFNVDAGLLMFLDDKETSDWIERLMTTLGDPFDPIGGPLDVDSFGPLNLNPATALGAIESSPILQAEFPGLLELARDRHVLEAFILTNLEASVWIAAAVLDQNRSRYAANSASGGVTSVELAVLRYRYGPDTVNRIASGSGLIGPNVAAELTTWRTGWWR